MNKTPIIHYSKDKRSLINAYFVALIPLIIFSIYKNGILLYQNDLIKFKDIFIPLYFYLISIVIAFLNYLITKKNLKELILSSLILTSTISLNTNMLIFPIVLFIALFITNYLKEKFFFNSLSLARLILVLSLLINAYSYLNIAEKLNTFNYNLFDNFLGFREGGLATTSIMLIIISFIILSFNKFYKRYIPLSATLSYLIFAFIFSLIFSNNYLNLIMAGHIYFSFIFIASDIYTSPNTILTHIIYGFIIGFITAILANLTIYESPYISTFIASLLIPLLNKIGNNWYFSKVTSKHTKNHQN